MDAKTRISGSTRFGGLIGRGLSHSLSPLIHNTSAAILGLDVVYHAFDFAEAPGQAFFDLMLSANCYGFNVTLPYKETVAKLLTQKGPGPLLTANTVFSRLTHWDVVSTDAEGFCDGLGEIGLSLNDFTAVIFMGYGGAAKALQAKVQIDRPGLPIFILRRTPGLGEDLAQGIKFVNFDPDELSGILKVFPNSLLIQCTSSPLRGDDLERFCPSLTFLKGAFVDLVYGTPSALLKEAEALEIPCQDGIPMLIYQALLAQRFWWGQSASFSDMKTALARQR